MVLPPPPPANILPPTPPTPEELIYRNLRLPRSLLEYDNYVVNNKFSAHAKFSCKFSLDFVEIIVPPSLANSVQVSRLLSSLNCPVSLIKLGKGRFSFVNTSIRFGLFFKFIRILNGYHGCSITIYRPDYAVLCYLDKIFKGLYLISQIEFTADMFCQDPGELYTLVACTAVLPWARAQLELPHPTIYFGSPRTSRRRGGRAYLKNINGSISVRLELVLKRNTLKIIIPDDLTILNTVTAENIFNKYRFMMIKTDMVRTRYDRVFQKVFGGDSYTLKMSYMFFKAGITKELYDRHRRTLKYISSLLGKNKYDTEHPFQARFRRYIHGMRFV